MICIWRVCLSGLMMGTNRNVIEAERDPEVSCLVTTKPFPTDSMVDGELVQRQFMLLFGEGWARTRESKKAGRCGVTRSCAQQSAEAIVPILQGQWRREGLNVT